MGMILHHSKSSCHRAILFCRYRIKFTVYIYDLTKQFFLLKIMPLIYVCSGYPFYTLAILPPSYLPFIVLNSRHLFLGYSSLDILKHSQMVRYDISSYQQAMTDIQLLGNHYQEVFIAMVFNLHPHAYLSVKLRISIPFIKSKGGFN